MAPLQPVSIGQIGDMRPGVQADLRDGSAGAEGGAPQGLRYDGLDETAQSGLREVGQLGVRMVVVIIIITIVGMAIYDGRQIWKQVSSIVSRIYKTQNASQKPHNTTRYAWLAEEIDTKIQ